MECNPKSAPPAFGQPGRVEQLGCAYQFHPMRRCGPAKQRVWLGSGGYSCRCRWRFANPYANGYGNSDGDANCNNHAECNSHSYTYGNDHALTHSYAEGDTSASADAASSSESVIGGREVTSDW